MEAIGLVASIITLISAASNAALILERVLGLRGVSLYVLGALNEVTDFKATLTLVQTAVDETQHQLPPAYRVEYNRLLDRAMGCMDAFTKYLRRSILREREEVDGAEKVIELKRRVKWMDVLGRGQAQCQIDAFQQELTSLKLNFVLAMSATNLKTTTRLSTIIQDVTIVHMGEVSGEPMVHGNAIDLPYAMEKAACMSTISSTTDNTIVDRNDFTSYVKIETIETATNRTCRSSCPCDCHVPLQGVTPRWLRGLVGAAFFKFTSAPLLNRRRCNYGHCQPALNGTGSLHFRYFFPTWFLPLGVEVAGSWRSLGGVGGTWSLRIPRLVTDRFLKFSLLCAMRHGTVIEVQQVMERNGVRAFDMLWYAFNEPLSTLTLALKFRKPLSFYNMLLDHGADLNLPSPLYGLTPAQTFSAGRVQGHFHEIFLSRSDLLDIGDVLNLAPATELILRGSIDSLRDLLRSQPSAVLTRDSLGNTPLHWAIKMANVDAVDLLLEAGADVHAVAKDTATPLCEAVDSDFESREICLKLLEAGADVDQVICHEGTALAEAVRRNRSVSTIKLLLDAGAHLHGIHGDDPVLIIAASESTSDACETLLLAGANIEARGSRGETAVMVAVGNNNHSVLEKLINLGARLDLELYDGDSIVIIAALHGDIETMRILETARIKGIPVDVKSREAYWYAFDRRYHYCFPKSVLPECVEMVAFQALLDSIVPAEYATLEYEHSEDSDAVHVPGAFPFDTDESDCDIGIPEAREWDDVDGCEEQRDSDDESRITPDDDRSGGEKEMEHASEDEAGSLT